MTASLSGAERDKVKRAAVSIPESIYQRMSRRGDIDWGRRTFIMGILNVTPNSFSGDGVMRQADDAKDNIAGVNAAVAQAIQFVKEGADIVDIGGESTRPGFEPVSMEEEMGRILPIIRAVRDALPHTVISIDTYRSETAEAALKAGADWINDIWGLQFDPNMKHIAKAFDCPTVIMHNGRNRPRLEKEDGAGGYYGYYQYQNLIEEVKSELMAAAESLISLGFSQSKIILDPGIGFGKTAPQNLELIHHLDRLKSLGFPILLGSSRKGFIGSYLGGLSADDRVEGTGATVAVGIDRGADIVRVHDVQAMSRIARMTDKIIRR